MPVKWFNHYCQNRYIFERIRHPPGCKHPANSSMASHISKPASISLKDLDYLRSQRKAKERPENGQGKAKGKPGHLTAKHGENPDLSEP